MSHQAAHLGAMGLKAILFASGDGCIGGRQEIDRKLAASQRFAPGPGNLARPMEQR